MNSTEVLKEHLGTVGHIFGHDADLVRTNALQHRINIHFAHITDKPNPGEYNVHVSTGTPYEVEAIANAQVVALGCIDLRQSYKIYELLKPDIFFTNAGGPIQPDLTRLQALTNLYAIIHKVNPKARLIAVAHDEICKGADHFTDGAVSAIRADMQDMAAYRIWSDQSWESRIKEHEFLLNYVQKFYEELRGKGVATEKVTIDIAEIHGDYFGTLHTLKHQGSPTGPLQFARGHSR